MAELQTILSSGDITNYQESSAAAGNTLLTSDEIDVKDTTALNAAKAYTDAEVLALLGTPTTVNAATYTVLAADRTLHVTYSTTGACTITIPSALIVNTFRLLIKDGGGSASENNITIATQGAETIDGDTSWIINGSYDWLGLYSDGNNLFIED